MSTRTVCRASFPRKAEMVLRRLVAEGDPEGLNHAADQLAESMPNHQSTAIPIDGATDPAAPAAKPKSFLEKQREDHRGRATAQ